MKLSMTAGLIGASLLIVLVPAEAQNRAQALTLTPFAGGYLFDARQDLESAPLFGLRAGYNFDARWGVELFGSYLLTESDRRAGPEANVESDVYRYGGTLLHHFRPRQRLVPFLAIGYARSTVVVPDLDRPNRHASLLEAGGGLKYFVADDFALRADLRHVQGFDPAIGNLEYSVGVSWQFGGIRPASAAPVAALPPSAPAAQICPACLAPVARLDSDGDGVEDLLDRCPETLRGLIVDAYGCVAPQSQVLKDVNFEYNAATLTATSRTTLDQLSKTLAAQLSMSMEVGGHTDSTGSEGYNLMLSQRRAEAVKAYLVAAGIDDTRISAAGYGESMPIGDNETDLGRAGNRRVTFEIRQRTAGTDAEPEWEQVLDQAIVDGK